MYYDLRCLLASLIVSTQAISHKINRWKTHNNQSTVFIFKNVEIAKELKTKDATLIYSEMKH